MRNIPPNRQRDTQRNRQADKPSNEHTLPECIFWQVTNIPLNEHALQNANVGKYQTNPETNINAKIEISASNETHSEIYIMTRMFGRFENQ